MILVPLAEKGHDIGKRETAHETVNGSVAEPHTRRIARELRQ